MPTMVPSRPMAPRIGFRAATVPTPPPRTSSAHRPKYVSSSVLIEPCSFARSQREPPRRRFAPGLDVGLELLPELLEESEGRHGRPFAEGADGVSHDVARDLVESIELLERGLALHDA